MVRRGIGIFTLGDQEIEAGAGQILVALPLTPHRFRNKGPGPLETIDIHQSPFFDTQWLE